MEKIQAMNQRAGGLASILAIGTANPDNCMYQADYPDYYFRVTNSEDNITLKEKFKRICDKSMIKKRYMHLTEEILKENPNICPYEAPSLNIRQEIMITEIPKLGQRAAMAAIEEWGQPKSAITHLIFCSTSGADMPGADYRLIKSLGLGASVRRVMLYNQGCFAGGTVLRIAKDLAENNPGSRVLVVCTSFTVSIFRGPSDDDMACLVGQAIFGDGAAALIIGADLEYPVARSETPVFRLVSAAQTILPDSEGAIEGHLEEVGLTIHLSPDVPTLISDNIERCLADVFSGLGVEDWNSLFWAPHPGGAAILREIEARARLDKDKLRAARHVLREYGNMSSVSVFFILDEMRRHSAEVGQRTTGEGLELGVLFGFGPGLTVETVVLQSVPIPLNLLNDKTKCPTTMNNELIK